MMSTIRSKSFPKAISLLLWLILALVVLDFTGPALSWSSQNEAYVKIERDYQTFRSSPRAKYRQFWMEYIGRFQKLYSEEPEGSLAPDCLYMMGTIYRDLYRHSGKRADLDEAADAYTRLCNHFSKSTAAEKGRKYLAAIEKMRGGSGEDKRNVEEKQSPESEGEDEISRIEGIKCWSTSDYTRIVINANNQVQFEGHLLKKDNERKKLTRLYVDIFNSSLSPDLKNPIPVMDGLLRYVRAGQYKADTVRVVLDIESLKKYKVFNLVNPFRIVIDITGDMVKGKPKHKDKDKDKELTLAQQLGLGIHKIILDAGHGGKDCGAIGINGLKEKDVALRVVRKLKKKIQEQLSCKVVLTRDGDKFLPLEERTAIANTREGDLFVSVHANAAPNKEAHGIETYFLNLSTDEHAMRVAARENATSTKNVSDLQKILNDLMLNSKINESCRLAECVQNTLVAGLSKSYDQVTNLGVKQAPFFVLIGAQMPAILVEISFLSNQMEANLLKKEEYLDHIADCLADGIRKYNNDTQLAYLIPELRSIKKP